MAAVNRIRKLVLSQIIKSKSNSFQNNYDITLQPSLSLFASRRGVASKLFVGGLSFYTSEKQLLEAFSQHGQVVEAKVVTDKVSDRSKGFGFITFASEDEAETAKTEMNGKALDGRVVFVDYAKPRTNFGDGALIARGPPDPTTEHFQVDTQARDGTASYTGTNVQLVTVQKNEENVIDKSIEKLKEASTDVWQGTQLLAIDVAAATGLVRRVLVGDELTEKEKQALQRTVTDVASVVPIGILMLLPVTAVGHAAMLAAIQRYVPSLIPSTYGPERLNLLRQLKKVKELETNETNPSENGQNAEELQC